MVIVLRVRGYETAGTGCNKNAIHSQAIPGIGKHVQREVRRHVLDGKSSGKSRELIAPFLMPLDPDHLGLLQSTLVTRLHGYTLNHLFMQIKGGLRKTV